MHAKITPCNFSLKNPDKIDAAGYGAAMNNTQEKGVTLEPWVSKAHLTAHLGCGTRFIEQRMSEGLPHTRFSRKMVRFRVTEVERWLITEGIR